jgi:hypothetical protein
VTTLSVLPCEPRAKTIELLLEFVSDLVEAGKISSLAVVMVNRDGSTSAVHSELPSLSTMVGAVARLQYDLCKED